MGTEEESMFLPIDSDTFCNVCCAEFLDSEDLNVHIYQVHNKSGIQCKFCSSSMRCLDQYAVHIRDTHLLKIRSCKYCNKMFCNVDLLKKHEALHVNSVPRGLYKCSQCDVNLLDCNDLELHEYELHNNVDSGIFLNECLPLLSSYLNIKASAFIQSFGTNIVYICTMCMFSTSDVEGYLKHLQERKCRSFVCNGCCNVYRDKKSLGRHMKVHKECDLTFRDMKTTKTCEKCNNEIKSSNYKKHIKICKQIMCRMCNLKLHSVNELSLHQSVEHPMAITMTVCKFCHREFVGNITLQKHIDRCHKKDMHLYKYACLNCEDKYFKHPKKLFAHYFSKHPDLHPFTCKICDEKYRVRKKFTLHIKLQHSSEGFVEFDESYCVFFTDKKSENPFQPKSFYPHQSKELVDCESYIECPIMDAQTDAPSDIQTEAQTDVPSDIQTDAPTDIQTDAPTDTEETKKLRSKKPLKIRFKEEKSKQYAQNFNSDQVANDGNQTDVSPEVPKRNVAGKSRKRSFKKQIISDTNASEHSDDEPLIKVKKRMKKRNCWNLRKPSGQKRKAAKRKQHSFTCNICNKYCYTYQNYHLHISMHYKNEAIKCIKCSKPYWSQAELEQHMTEAHGSSKLTETLKNLLERRKKGTTTSQCELSPAEKFRQTIKKFKYEHVTGSVTIKEVKENLSVQKFIENFMPEETNKKPFEIQMSVTVKTLSKTVFKPPVIKMTKFKPKPTPTNVKLAMPVKFKNIVSTDKAKVNVSLIQTYSSNNDENNDFDHEVYMQDEDVDDNDVEDFVHERNDTVPEVAQEVMLETQEPKQSFTHKIVIPELSKQVKSNDVKIAHLLPEAPFYKIVKMTDVLNQSKKSEPVVMKDEGEEEIKLPSGKKLINVNPLAHLLGDTPIEKIMHINKYRPKPRNFETAIAKALLKLEKTAPKKRRLPKKDQIEQ